MRIINRVFRRENTLILLLVVSAILGLIKIPQKIGVTNDQIIMALLAVIALDTLIIRLGYLDRIENNIENIGKKIESRISPDEFFGTRSDLPPFLSCLEKSEDIWMSGRNLFGIVSVYGKNIEQEAKNGKKFRFLLLNFQNEGLMNTIANGSITHHDGKSAKQLSKEAYSRLKKIQEKCPDNSIDIKLINYPVSYSYLITDGRKIGGEIIVEIYNYKISAAERPNFVLRKKIDYKMYAFHLKQYEEMWKDSIEFT